MRPCVRRAKPSRLQARQTVLREIERPDVAPEFADRAMEAGDVAAPRGQHHQRFQTAVRAQRGAVPVAPELADQFVEQRIVAGRDAQRRAGAFGGLARQRAHRLARLIKHRSPATAGRAVYGQPLAGEILERRAARARRGDERLTEMKLPGIDQSPGVPIRQPGFACRTGDRSADRADGCEQGQKTVDSARRMRRYGPKSHSTAQGRFLLCKVADI
jgi:hypothetical protein